MNHNGAANDRMRTVQSQQSVFDIKSGDASLVCYQITQIAQVSLFVVRPAVCLIERIKVWTRAYATVCQIAELMNMHGMQARA